MGDDKQSGLAGPQQVIIGAIYKPAMVVLVIWLGVSITVGIAIKLLDLMKLVTPRWFDPLDLALGTVGDILTPAGGAVPIFTTAVTTFGALIIATLLLHCSPNVPRFEKVIVILCAIFGLLGFVVVYVLPSPGDAAESIRHGDRLVHNVVLLLTKNSNVALAVAGAALGVKLSPDRK